MENTKEFWAYVYFKLDKKYKVVPHTHIKYFSPKTETDFDKAREYQIRWREYDQCDAKPSDASDTDDEDYWRGQILRLSSSRSQLMEWLRKNQGKRMLVHPVKTTLEDISRPGKSDVSEKPKSKECINVSTNYTHKLLLRWKVEV